VVLRRGLQVPSPAATANPCAVANLCTLTYWEFPALDRNHKSHMVEIANMAAARAGGSGGFANCRSHEMPTATVIS
jgi:hypothetical protein